MQQFVTVSTNEITAPHTLSALEKKLLLLRLDKCCKQTVLDGKYHAIAKSHDIEKSLRIESLLHDLKSGQATERLESLVSATPTA